MLERIFLKDSNYEITEYKEEEEKITIYVKSNLHICKCPKCKKESSTYHATYVRKIQDTPIHNTETWLYVLSYEFECTNDRCEQKTFTEELPFARRNKVKTDALIQFILSISIFLSSTSASLIMSFLGIKVSADVIDDIVKNIKVEDNPDVEEAGIDDVSIKKGQTYATAIYDMKDRHLITLIEGRDAESVKEWLSNHKKLKVIARDRASAYATAISEILPDCTQVADRFHLFQNLIEHLKNIFYKEMPDKIFIRNDEIVDSVKKVAVELSNIDETIFNSYNYDNSKVIDEYGNAIKFDNKKHDLDSKQYVEQAKRRAEKKELVIKAREKMKNASCHETKKIAEELGISATTLYKYKRMSKEDVENIANIKDYKKGKTLMDDYMNIIFKMLKDGVPQEYIMAYVIKAGYKGSDRYLRDYINIVAKNNGMRFNEYKSFIKLDYPKDVTVITRYELLKYILTLDPKKNKNETTAKYMDIIIEKYPIVKDIRDAFKSFHDTIFGGNTDLLDTFIESYDNLIPSFCNGLKKDIAPVKNAISLQINSGFVEGNNNKFKLIKRIVYGKQKLCNLLKKSYLGFLATTDNFCIEDIVEGVLEIDDYKR